MVCFIHSSSSISNRAGRRKLKPLKSHLFKLFKFLPSSISYRTKLDKKNSQFPKRNVWIGAKKNSAELCIFFKFFCFLPLFRLKKLLLLTSGLFLTLKNIYKTQTQWDGVPARANLFFPTFSLQCAVNA